MPVDQKIVLKITCDNPNCPGNTLDPKAREGWTFVNSEVYGEPLGPGGVFCCAGCVTGYIDTMVVAEQHRAEAKAAAEAAGEAEAEPMPTTET